MDTTAKTNDPCQAGRAAQTRRKQTSRLQSMRRLLVLIDLMRFRRFPALTSEIAEELNERLQDNYHQRTVRRDLELLATAGLVAKTTRPGKLSQSFNTWHWNGFDSLRLDGGIQQ